MRLITDIDQKTWDIYISSFPEPAILQSYEWGELKSLHGWKPNRFAVEKEGKIIAAASVLKRKLPYINFNLFYCPRGPVLDFKNTEAFDFLLSEIKKEAKKQNAILLKIDPQIPENEVGVVEMLKSRGFKFQKKQIQPRSTLIIVLSKSEEELLKSFEEKTRYNIRLSAKKGVVVREVSNDYGVETFYNIYKETAGRDNFLIHPLKYYQNIKKCLIDKGMANIFIAYYEDKPIAGVYVFTFGKRAWYMYGASSNAHRNLMPNHALHWEVIKWAKQRGYTSYDLFGIPSTPNPQHPLWGVYKFKKGFNGALVKYIGVYDLALNPILYYLFDKGVSIFQNLRSLILKGKISDSLSED